jgi:hypothetical protein
VTKLNSFNLPVIRSPTLSILPEIEHGFFTRQGGISTGIYTSLNCGYESGDKQENVTENRLLVSKCLSIDPPSLISAYQVHGTNVATVEKPWGRNATPKVDGMVTNRKGLALGILTADCAPVLFADPTNGIIGACHAGWRGALDGIIDSTVLAMEALGGRRGSIKAVIGPCIAQNSYQVEFGFLDQFAERDPTFVQYFINDDKTHLRFDLSGFVELMIKRSGILFSENIDHDNCTATETFFSYRRTKLAGSNDYGRSISAIALRN